MVMHPFEYPLQASSVVKVIPASLQALAVQVVPTNVQVPSDPKYPLH